jgi:CHASE2 domain-containing sensor protein
MHNAMANRQFILVGLILTLLAAIAQLAGCFQPVERSTYDIRARNCQAFMRPPSDKLLHVDIDDGSLAAIGTWPWPRSIMADMIGELDAAGAQVIGIDVLYYESSSKRFEPRGDGTTARVDDDALLAAAIKKSGRVILSGERSNGPKEPGVLPLLADAAARSGFVERASGEEGILRQLPVVRRSPGGGLTFSADIQLACAALGVKTDSGILVENGALRLQSSSGASAVIIPITWSREGTGLMQVPFFGTSDWTTAYDLPAHLYIKQHIAAAKVYEAAELRHKIEANNRTAERAIATLKELFDDPTLQGAPSDASDRPRYQARIEAAIKQLRPVLDEPGAGEPDFDAARALRDIERTNSQLEQRITQSRTWMRDHVKDRVVLVGWIATGTTDYVPTSIHRACPGVVVRGMAVGGILTGELWRVAPWWLDFLVTIALAAVMIFIAAKVRPQWALLWAVLLCSAYALVNGLLLFDWGNLIVAVTGPIAAVAAVTLAVLFMNSARPRPQPL